MAATKAAPKGKERYAPRASVPFATPQKAYANVVLRFGLVSIPISIKPLMESSSGQGLSGTRLCPKHSERLSQRYLCGEGEEHEHYMPQSETVTGYETFKKSAEYIVLEDGILDAIAEERTGDLAIERICPIDSIEPALFDKPYLVWPQDKGAAAAFDLLTALLRDSGKAAVCKGVLTNRARAIVFRWSDSYEVLLAHTCHFDSRIRHTDLDLARLGAEQRGKPGRKELEMARPLIASLDGDYDPSEIQDEFALGLEEAISAAVRGEKPKSASLKKPAMAPSDDLLASLKASVDALGNGKKPAAKKKPSARARK